MMKSIKRLIHWHKFLLFVFLAISPLTVEGNSMHMVLEKSPKELDTTTYLSLQEWYVHFNTTATLVELDGDNQIVSGIATKWTVEDDGRKYIFILDANRRWSDGSLITAVDVLRSVFLESKHKNAKLLKTLIQEAHFESPNRIVVLLKAPNIHFLYHLARPEFGVLHSSLQGENTCLRQGIPTSGDYMVESVTASKLVLTPNPYVSRIVPSNPQRITFVYLKNQKDVVDLLFSGELDFYEVQSGELLHEKVIQEKYQIVSGALDNLATLQARRVSDVEREAMRVLGRYLDRTKFSMPMMKPAASLVAYSVAPLKNASERMTRDEAVKLLRGREIVLRLQFGEDATQQQSHDAQIIHEQAKEIGIFFQRESVADFRKKWEDEAYQVILTRMGVYAYDEVELLHGYFCAGFKPYRSMMNPLCSEIRTAAKPGASSEQVAELLGQVYKKIDASGLIVPLYHYPRRFLISKRWNLRQYNALLPYPIFNRFLLKTEQ